MHSLFSFWTSIDAGTLKRKTVHAQNPNCDVFEGPHFGYPKDRTDFYLHTQVLKHPIDNSLSGLVALNEKEVNKKHETIEEFSVDEFHAHAIVKVLKNEPVTKVNIGGYFGLECTDTVFDKLLKYIVAQLPQAGDEEDNALEVLQLCHKTIM